MRIEGPKVQKRITEDNIIAALPEKWRLIRVNWKKGKIHIADGFNNVKVVSLESVAQ